VPLGLENHQITNQGATNMHGVIMALSNFRIVGCLNSATYRGAEHPWPNGWKDLLDRGVTFDQVDVDLPSKEMANAYIERFKPRGSR
jgi:hypothetical protein